jgi:hypothetical protein
MAEAEIIPLGEIRAEENRPSLAKAKARFGEFRGALP